MAPRRLSRGLPPDDPRGPGDIRDSSSPRVADGSGSAGVHSAKGLVDPGNGEAHCPQGSSGFVIGFSPLPAQTRSARPSESAGPWPPGLIRHFQSAVDTSAVRKTPMDAHEESVFKSAFHCSIWRARLAVCGAWMLARGLKPPCSKAGTLTTWLTSTPRVAAEPERQRAAWRILEASLDQVFHGASFHSESSQALRS